MLTDFGNLNLDGVYLCPAAGSVRLGQTEMHLYEDPTHPDAPPFAVDDAALKVTGALMTSPYTGATLFLQDESDLQVEEVVPGAVVFWRDPDDEICSGPVQVVQVNSLDGRCDHEDATISVATRGGGSAEVLFAELHRWRGPHVLRWDDLAREEYARRVAADESLRAQLLVSEVLVPQGPAESTEEYAKRCARLDFDRGDAADFAVLRRAVVLDVALMLRDRETSAPALRPSEG